MSEILEKQVFSLPKSLKDVPTHFCPGCHHGIIHRLVAQTIDDLKLQDISICVGSVGCSVFIYDYIDVDTVEAPHGRAPAVATGIKRARPENFVFAYQGDGDLAAIGFSEIVHCANRGERVTIVFVNNTVYGMTGGQMAPTTLLGQKTTTTPYGRSESNEGYPLKMAEMLASLEGTAFSARVAVNNIKNLMKTKKALKKAFMVQLEDLGFGFVEILSACPTNWHLTPLEANMRVEKEMMKYFPLGIYKDKLEDKK